MVATNPGIHRDFRAPPRDWDLDTLLFNCKLKSVFFFFNGFADHVFWKCQYIYMALYGQNVAAISETRFL